MAIPKITPLPQPPTTQDIENFDERGDAFLPAIVQAADEMNDVVDYMNSKVLSVEEVEIVRDEMLGIKSGTEAVAAAADSSRLLAEFAAEVASTAAGMPTTGEEDVKRMINPVGSYKDFAAPQSDGSWLTCDGAAYLINAYPELFESIGLTYSEPQHLEETDVINAAGLGEVYATDISEDGEFIAFWHSLSPYLAVYERGEDGRFLKVAGPIAPATEPVETYKSKFGSSGPTVDTSAHIRHGIKFNEYTGLLYCGDAAYDFRGNTITPRADVEVFFGTERADHHSRPPGHFGDYFLQGGKYLVKMESLSAHVGSFAQQARYTVVELNQTGTLKRTLTFSDSILSDRSQAMFSDDLEYLIANRSKNAITSTAMFVRDPMDTQEFPTSYILSRSEGLVSHDYWAYDPTYKTFFAGSGSSLSCIHFDDESMSFKTLSITGPSILGGLRVESIARVPNTSLYYIGGMEVFSSLKVSRPYLDSLPVVERVPAPAPQPLGNIASVNINKGNGDLFLSGKGDSEDSPFLKVYADSTTEVTEFNVPVVSSRIPIFTHIKA